MRSGLITYFLLQNGNFKNTEYNILFHIFFPNHIKLVYDTSNFKLTLNACFWKIKQRQIYTPENC